MYLLKWFMEFTLCDLRASHKQLYFIISKWFQGISAEGIISCALELLATEEEFLSCAALNGVMANLT